MATVTTPGPITEPGPSGLSGDALYEIIDGRVVEVEGMGVYGSLIASQLFLDLASFVHQAHLGRVVSETLFRISARQDRRPDLAFVSYDRWAKKAPAPDTNAWDVIPELMIEVVSQTDVAWEVLAKVGEYFDAGVRAAWLIYPNLEVIHAYESFTRIRVLTRADELDGGDFLPGFRLPLATLFEGEAGDEPGAATS